MQNEKAADGFFGFDVDNTIGGTPQPNKWTKDWVSFFREQRLLHQVNLTGDTQLKKLVRPLSENLEACPPYSKKCLFVYPVTSMLLLWHALTGTTMWEKAQSFSCRSGAYRSSGWLFSSILCHYEMWVTKAFPDLVHLEWVSRSVDCRTTNPKPGTLTDCISASLRGNSEQACDLVLKTNDIQRILEMHNSNAI